MNKAAFIKLAVTRAARDVRKGALPDVEEAIARAVFSDGFGTIHVRTARGELRTGDVEQLLALVHASTISGLPERARRGGEHITGDEVDAHVRADRVIGVMGGF